MSCLVCGGAAAPGPLYRVRDVEVVRCRECGLGRALSPPGFDPASIYTETYFQGGQADGYVNYQGSRDVLVAEFRRVLRDLAAAGASDGRLLEIGCAYGFFLDEARASFQVSGVELASAAVAACRERRLDVVQEADDAFYRSRAPFDVVVMLDVLEHLEAPDEVLRTVHRHTRPGALLVVTTGDFGSLAARLLGRRWRLMTPPQHLWFFTELSLARLLQQHGFRVLRTTRPWKLVPLHLIAYQLFRYLGGQDWLRHVRIPGGVPVNLFDAMRVIAERN
ncbi:MAG: class I SAM-dependent methyltransferase [Candidatus Rokuibacteriota bacterium]